MRQNPVPHGNQCRHPNGYCSHLDHNRDLTPHARQLFVSANGQPESLIWGGYRFWLALSEAAPDAQTYDEAVKASGL